jgi:hypothetical protein
MIGAEEAMEIKGSPTKLIGILLGGVLLTATSAALAVHWLPDGRPGDNSVVWGWVGLLFFGLATAVALWRLLTADRTIITITPDGIKDRRLSAAVVPWRAIQRLSTAYISGQRFILLAVNPSIEKRLRLTLVARLSRRPNRMLGLDGLCISAVGLKVDYDTLFRVCLAHWQAAQGPAAGPEKVAPRN